ncbi:MAG: class I SAM-dependent methyltransferase [Magnetococcus sp. WYHC-3]
MTLDTVQGDCNMLLNALEKRAMNSPLRLLTQRWLDVALFLRHADGLQGRRVLEMGIGRGRGISMILEHFSVARVEGFDLDPDMVARARHHLRHRCRHVGLWVGDAARIPVPAHRYAAVFDFGIIHHVPLWREALDEAVRVVEPGGRLFLFEMLAGFVDHPWARRLMLHPREDRFDYATLREALLSRGLRILEQRRWGEVCAWFVVQRQPFQEPPR